MTILHDHGDTVPSLASTILYTDPAFLDVVADVYHAGRSCRLRDYTVDGEVFRLIDVDGTGPLATQTFIDFHESIGRLPSDAPKLASLPRLAGAARGLLPLDDYRQQPGWEVSEGAPTVLWQGFASWEDYLELLQSRHALSDDRRRRRKLGETVGTLEFRAHDDAADVLPTCFDWPDEPILRVTAPLPQAQLVESRLLNIVHFQTLVASKAARMRTAARDKMLIDFGMRRAHGAEAALFAARAAWLTGFNGTATAEAGRRFGIPVVGTMAHSFVQAHPSEASAFEAFARSRPLRPTLLVDTYDTEAAVAKLIAIAPRLGLDGIAIGGVRLDSGDLGAHARAVRSMLDAAALNHVTVFASGNLDEHRMAALLQDGAPIDGFGVGTALSTSSDAPALDMVYKLQSYAGVARRKRSEGKATWPGVKQVSRCVDAAACPTGDLVHLAHEDAPGVPLLQPCMRAGRRLLPTATLAQARERHARERACLPSALLRLDPAPARYRVEISAGLHRLTAQVDSATH